MKNFFLILFSLLIPLSSGAQIQNTQSSGPPFDNVQDEIAYYDGLLLQKKAEMDSANSNAQRDLIQHQIKLVLPYSTPAEQDEYRKHRGYHYIQKEFEHQEKVYIGITLKLDPEWEREPGLNEKEYEQQRNQHILDIRKNLVKKTGLGLMKNTNFDQGWFFSEESPSSGIIVNKNIAKKLYNSPLIKYMTIPIDPEIQ